MSMYTEITITLSDSFDEAGATEVMKQWLDEAAEFFDHSEYVTPIDGGAGGFEIRIADNNKYQLENLHHYAEDFTRGYGTAKVEIVEEWSGEEPNTEVTTYVGGEVVDERHTELVSGALGQLVTQFLAARELALAAAWGDSNDDEIEKLQSAVGEAEAIVAALGYTVPEITSPED